MAAGAILASIYGARVIVVALGVLLARCHAVGDRRKDAQARLGIALVLRAGVAVVAGHGRACASPCFARISGRAGQAIAAGAAVGDCSMGALTSGGVTTVDCTRILVVADSRCATFTGTAVADIAQRAQVVVAAGMCGVDRHAFASHRVAFVVGAWVVVVAGQLAGAAANSIGAADVAGRADAAIIAGGSCCGYVAANHGGETAIVGCARILVVAIGSRLASRRCHDIRAHVHAGEVGSRDIAGAGVGINCCNIKGWCPRVATVSQRNIAPGLTVDAVAEDAIKVAVGIRGHAGGRRTGDRRVIGAANSAQNQEKSKTTMEGPACSRLRGAGHGDSFVALFSFV